MPEERVGEWSGVENRRHKRVPLQVAIECRGNHSVIQGRAENISTSGLLVRCADPFPQDIDLKISFQLPDGGQRIECAARVAHMVPGVFMGLEFASLAESVRAEIARYVESNARVAKARP